MKIAKFPVIAVTSGEPAGVGPELCCRLFEKEFSARLVILGDRDLLAARAAALGAPVRFSDYQLGMPPPPGRLEILHSPLAAPSIPGTLNAANSPYVLALLDRAVEGVAVTSA